jgi:hypothetical protein
MLLETTCMSVKIYHKAVSPISAATIWAVDGDYLPVEWTVLLVSLLSAAAFVIAMRRPPVAWHLNERVRRQAREHGSHSSGG